jgi:hypothetical protein
MGMSNSANVGGRSSKYSSRCHCEGVFLGFIGYRWIRRFNAVILVVVLLNLQYFQGRARRFGQKILRDWGCVEFGERKRPDIEIQQCVSA